MSDEWVDADDGITSQVHVGDLTLKVGLGCGSTFWWVLMCRTGGGWQTVVAMQRGQRGCETLADVKMVAAARSLRWLSAAQRGLAAVAESALMRMVLSGGLMDEATLAAKGGAG